MDYLSFPGLGIPPFHIDRIALRIGPVTIAWYGILITCGMILAVLCAFRMAKREGISMDDISDFAFYVILAGVIGARAYYVIFTWNIYHYLATDGTFLQNLWHTFYNCIAVWEGGLAIYGGVLAGLLCGFLFARKRNIPFLKIFDILVPSVLIGQVIGRWGNFINIEAYGTETTLPWRMGILRYASELSDSGKATLVFERYVHPTFLYESLWNLVGLILVLAVLYPRKKFDGQIFCFYMIWYGFGRMLIESLRTDSLMLGNLRISQGVGFLSVVLGILLLTVFLRKYRNTVRSGGEAYKPVYASVGAEEAADRSEDPAESDASEETENTEETENKEETVESEGDGNDGGENH